MTEPLTLTKLIILYMLDQVDFPMTKAQIFDFVLEKEYSNYFNLEQASYELIDSGLIDSSSTNSQTLLELADSGRDTLNYFKGRISDGIKSDIATYFSENKLQIHNEISVLSNYYRDSNGEFIAELCCREHNSDLMNLKLTMPSEEAAQAVSDKWKANCQDIYSYLLEKLF